MLGGEREQRVLDGQGDVRMEGTEDTNKGEGKGKERVNEVSV